MLSANPHMVTVREVANDNPILSSVYECFIREEHSTAEYRMEIAVHVWKAVERHCPNKSHIAAVRATLFKDSPDLPPLWLRIEWRWQGVEDVTAFVLLDRAPCNVAILFASGEFKRRGQRYEKVTLKWAVTDFEFLPSLFVLVHRNQRIERLTTIVPADFT